MVQPTPIERQAKDRPPGRELANDPDDNPCFGCGPDNADGMRLRFYDDGEVVRAPATLDERHQSWEGFANMGLVFTGMMETGAWAVWERLGPSRMAAPETVFTQRAPAKTGRILYEARLDVAGETAKVDVTALQEGMEVARAAWSARRAKPEEAKQVLTFPNVPRSLKQAFEDRASERT